MPPVTCPSCKQALADETDSCPACGAVLRGRGFQAGHALAFLGLFAGIFVMMANLLVGLVVAAASVALGWWLGSGSRDRRAPGEHAAAARVEEHGASAAPLARPPRRLRVRE